MLLKFAALLHIIYVCRKEALYKNSSVHIVYSLVFSVRVEVFKAVTMKNGVFWDVTPCGSCKNQRFGGT
jgi:hypothetical protein